MVSLKIADECPVFPDAVRCHDVELLRLMLP